MKFISLASIIFSLRTFAAAMLALYVSYRLDLARPTWAFITVYIVSAPLLGAGRSKGIYRMCGTAIGAVFTVIAIPNLVDAPELLVLAIALWIAGCLYLATVDGTPRAYAFMLSGYTAALIGFPSVNAPQTIFDTALSRTEEIGLAILCVEIMSWLPFNQRAGDALKKRIDKCLLDTRLWAISILKSAHEDVPAIDRSQLMIDAANLDALRIHARYDTPHFRDVEGWVIQLQRRLHDFFADLVIFEAQIKTLKAHDSKNLSLLQPIVDAILAWIATGVDEVPQKLWDLLVSASSDPSMQPLVRSGVLDTVSDLVQRRGECMNMRAKIIAGVKAEPSLVPVAHHVDHRQAAFYGLAITGLLILMSSFWIKTSWPDGGTAAMLATVLCCFFSSLEAPPKAASLFLVMSIIGSLIGWCYDFVIFPHIDGFPLLVYVLALSCIPIGMVMANPVLTGIMLPVIIGINLASVQNRFEADIGAFLNGFIAQTLGVVVAGATLGFVRVMSLRGATDRLLNANGRSLALLAQEDQISGSNLIDRISHRAGMAFIRAPGLKEARELVVRRILLDLQVARAMVQIKTLLPRIAPEMLLPLSMIRSKIAAHFSGRRGLKDPAPSVCDDIRNLIGKIDRGSASYDAMRLSGLMKTLSRGLGKEPA